MTSAQRRTLAELLARVHPGHPRLADLSSPDCGDSLLLVIVFSAFTCGR
ncbi:hypothetical protein ACH4F6_34330 [Streptomyces sp. NPDC017936]